MHGVPRLRSRIERLLALLTQVTSRRLNRATAVTEPASRGAIYFVAGALHVDLPARRSAASAGDGPGGV